MEYTKQVRHLFYSLPFTFLSIFFLILIDSKLYKLFSQLPGTISEEGIANSAYQTFMSSSIAPLVIFAHILVLILLAIFFTAYINSSNSESVSGLYLLIYSTILGILMPIGYLLLLIIR